MLGPQDLIVTLRNASGPDNVGQVCNLPWITHFQRIGRLQTCPTLAIQAGPHVIMEPGL